MLKKILVSLLLFLTVAATSAAQQRELAITIDDLPFVGEAKNFHLDMIIQAFKENDVPATGFVIAGEVNPDHWPMLRKFRDSGLGLGNHTFSHANLDKMDTASFIEEIETADELLLPILTEPKYFRYPYLAVGKRDKKNKVESYLFSKNYRIAPVTIDSKDFTFNQLLLSVPEKERRNFLNVLKACYLDFIWQQTLQAEEHNRLAHTPDKAHILLIHANLLNAYVLPDIIRLYKQRGFVFVSLSSALKTFGNDPSLARNNAPQSINDDHAKHFFAWD